MSRPTTAFFDLPRPNTGYVLTEPQTRAVRKADTRTPKPDRAVNSGGPRPEHRSPYRPDRCSRLQLRWSTTKTARQQCNLAATLVMQDAQTFTTPTARQRLCNLAATFIGASSAPHQRVCHTLDSAQKG